MPEIAEVALTAEILEKYLLNKKLESFDFVDGKYIRKSPDGYDDFFSSLPLTVKQISSRGKFMWFELNSNKKNSTWYIWNTFGLNGMWSFKEHSYTKAILTFTDGRTAYYSDMRNFGTFKFSQNLTDLESKLESLSPDFLKDDDFDISKISKIRMPIVKILMDQKKVGSGLGNYLVAEILYKAKLSPHRLGTEMSESDIDRLTNAIKYVVKLSYVDNHIGYMIELEKEASKIGRIDYHSTISLKNKTFKFKVYRKKFDPLGNEVKAEKIVGSGVNKRTTYWVPAVQK